MTALYRREATQPYTESRISRIGGVFRLPPVPGHGGRGPGKIGRCVAHIRASIREFLRRQRVMSELASLSDRELADIGISRADIGRIFDPEFAARHAAEYGPQD